LPRRQSNNEKRRLIATPEPALIAQLLSTVTYKGSSKHKSNPHLFDLPPHAGARGDETLCDAHAGLAPEQMAAIPGMIQRGLRAGLVGPGGLIWAVADNGWIFEGHCTNRQQAEYHGYPVRASEPIGESIDRRFADWALSSGLAADVIAAGNCKALYGFKT
jgi:hypothetical protein